MATAEKPQLLYYQKVAELFYALAATNLVVQKSEFEILGTLVLEQWNNLKYSEDPYFAEAATQMKIVFEWFDYENLDANDCFESFADYKNEHPQLFNNERNNIIWQTANTIVDAFAGKSKAEIKMLSKLNSLLNQ
ncbi:hypothetical protein QRD02_07330 [Aequorivita sp. SDUM287046]|uniref:TerB family tellurite resistance protein n=1 Tax=Aequorivita aurantiaca TaxID=3053356 RepID=A0ABT8DM29_9FLAO|nr:hypothetical protein [Aequorivita aurantiaca]MDN3724190.1 hypothetical protein [Aequorivita aurantiaca]